MSGASKENLGPQGLPVLGKACLTAMDSKLNVLNEKVDRLLHFQEDVTEKLHCVCQGMGSLQQGLQRLEASRGLGLAGVDCASAADAQAGWPEVLKVMRAVQQDGAQHGARLEALFRMVVAVDKAIALVRAVLQSSKLVDFIMQGRKGSLADVPEEVGSVYPDLARREAQVPGVAAGSSGQADCLRRAEVMLSLSCVPVCPTYGEKERLNLRGHRWISSLLSAFFPREKKRQHASQDRAWGGHDGHSDG